jgi:hypothetical protein
VVRGGFGRQVGASKKSRETCRDSRTSNVCYRSRDERTRRKRTTNEDIMELYSSDTAERLTPKKLGITRQQYEAVVSMSQGVAGEGHVRPDCLRDTEYPRVYAA